MENKNQQNKNDRHGKEMLRDYAHWTGLAFQMIALVLAGYFTGKKGDQFFNHSTPWLTLTFVILGVIGSMLLAIRHIQKDSQNRDQQKPDDDHLL